ncbi:hypothetical protein OQA88_13605 [Cercophora sp. LCS_1]
MSEILDAYLATPPLARTTTTAVVVTSFSIWLFGRLDLGTVCYLPGWYLAFPPEIWRLVTTFLISMPRQGLIFDPYFIYQYLKQLETGNPKFNRKEDVAWYLITVCGMILLANAYYLGEPMLLGAFSMALCYTAHQDMRGQKSQFVFFTVPSQAVPYCQLLMSLLVGGWSVQSQIAGILAAHMHDFLTRLYPQFGGGANLLPTPGILSYLVETPRFLRRDYGTAVRPSAAGTSSGSTTGASTGSVLPDSWRTRGSGHRLGGD